MTPSCAPLIWTLWKRWESKKIEFQQKLIGTKQNHCHPMLLTNKYLKNKIKSMLTLCTLFIC